MPGSLLESSVAGSCLCILSAIVLLEQINNQGAENKDTMLMWPSFDLLLIPCQLAACFRLHQVRPAAVCIGILECVGRHAVCCPTEGILPFEHPDIGLQGQRQPCSAGITV